MGSEKVKNANELVFDSRLVGWIALRRFFTRLTLALEE